MKKCQKYQTVILIIMLLLVSGCEQQKPEESTAMVEETTAENLAAAAGGEAYGLEKEDFYQAVNGDWLNSHEIPSDKISIGGFADLNDQIEALLMNDFNQMLSSGNSLSGSLGEFLKYYQMAMDFETRSSLGTEPLLPLIGQIESLESLDDMNPLLQEWILTGMPLPFQILMDSDMENTSRYALYLQAPALILPDPSYYENDSGRQLLAVYQENAVKLLVLTGKDQQEAEKIVDQALAFDRMLVPLSKTAEEASDMSNYYNPVSFQSFLDGDKGLDLRRAIRELIGTSPQSVIIPDEQYFSAWSQVINEDTFPLLKSWILVQTLYQSGPYLNDEFRETAAAYSQAIRGQKTGPGSEQAAYRLAASLFGEVVGDYYGHTYFGEEAKEQVTQMVEKMTEVYKTRLLNNQWLGEKTKETAIRKLELMEVQIGYPDAVDPVYEEIKMIPVKDGGSLLTNGRAVIKKIYERHYSRFNEVVDRNEWGMTAHTVNAMYNPLRNLIAFPAGILQAPFYSLEQGSSSNYGGIGAVIAHEISHAFDTNGSLFDEYGNYRNWWTQEDYDHYRSLTGLMEAQFDGVPYAGGVVNGKLTVSENIADAGGLSCALEAAKAQPDADLEAFFMSWATIWRVKMTPEYESMLLETDVHAPAKLRVNIQLQNLDEFFEVFDIQDGDGMYLPPGKRIRIW